MQHKTDIINIKYQYNCTVLNIVRRDFSSSTQYPHSNGTSCCVYVIC